MADAPPIPPPERDPGTSCGVSAWPAGIVCVLLVLAVALVILMGMDRARRKTTVGDFDGRHSAIHVSRSFSTQEEATFYATFMAQALLAEPNRKAVEVHDMARRAWFTHIGIPFPEDKPERRVTP